MSKEIIPIAVPSVGDEEWKATRESFTTGWLTQGPKVAAFEKQFAERHSVEYAIATSSCTTGLHLALVALGVGPGDEVIIPAFTWVATANVVQYCGATPIFCDVDKESFNIDPSKIAELVTSRTKAVIVVHLFGLCADIDAIKALLPGHVAIIEDAACAAGSTYKDRSAGSLGTVGVFSFHPRKIISTGEGGMITTNDAELASRINMFRNHGASISEEQRHNGPRPYLLPEFNYIGFNYRMTDMQGAVGIVQLGKLDHFLEERRSIARFYDVLLQRINWISTPSVTDNSERGLQAYVCRIDSERAPLPRNELMERMNQQGCSTRPGTHSVPGLGCYQKNPSRNCPVATACEAETIALPFYNGMNNELCSKVVEILIDSAAAVV